MRLSNYTYSLSQVATSAGLVCLIGLKSGDEGRDTDVIVKKILETRLFHDAESGKRFKSSIVDEGGEILCVSQVCSSSKPDGLEFGRSLLQHMDACFSVETTAICSSTTEHF